jgi:hypothetical protein
LCCEIRGWGGERVQTPLHWLRRIETTEKGPRFTRAFFIAGLFLLSDDASLAGTFLKPYAASVPSTSLIQYEVPNTIASSSKL